MASQKGLVSIVTINLNGLENLRDLLPSLLKLKYKNVEMIIVDHGSTDGSIEYIKRHYPRVKLLEKKKNLGFAKGNNLGVKETKGEYVLLLNDDTVVQPNLLTELVAALEKEKILGVVQPKIIFVDSRKLQSAGAFLTSSGFLYHFGYDKNPKLKKYNESSEIFSANGSCMLIKREVIDKVGLFDDEFFLYFEETDFCWRVWLAGYIIKYVPTTSIFHKGGSTTRKLPTAFINFHSFKNRISAIIKNLGLWELIKTLPIHLLLTQAVVFSFLLRGRVGVAISIQQAVFWNLTHLGKTLNNRKKVQEKLRKISDKKLMKRVKKKVRLLYYYYLFTELENYKD